MTYKLKSKISSKGYPVHTKSGAISQKWKKAHPAANVAARKKFGSSKAKQIAKLVQRTPDNELLGTHTKSGNIFISRRVPKKLRAAIACHERVEHKLMSK